MKEQIKSIIFLVISFLFLLICTANLALGAKNVTTKLDYCQVNKSQLEGCCDFSLDIFVDEKRMKLRKQLDCNKQFMQDCCPVKSLSKVGLNIGIIIQCFADIAQNILKLDFLTIPKTCCQLPFLNILPGCSGSQPPVTWPSPGPTYPPLPQPQPTPPSEEQDPDPTPPPPAPQPDTKPPYSPDPEPDPPSLPDPEPEPDPFPPPVRPQPYTTLSPPSAQPTDEPIDWPTAEPYPGETVVTTKRPGSPGIQVTIRPEDIDYPREKKEKHIVAETED